MTKKRSYIAEKYNFGLQTAPYFGVINGYVGFYLFGPLDSVYGPSSLPKGVRSNISDKSLNLAV